jgi:hypothetical protein
MPLLAALVCRILAATGKPEWLVRAQLAIGEYTLYIFLCFSYLAFLALFIQMNFLSSSWLDYAGIGGGVLFAVVGVIYMLVLTQASDAYFTEFRNRFSKDSYSKRFYLLIMVERIASPCLLVTFVAKTYGNVPVIVLYLFLTIYLLKVGPYLGKGKNCRPLANYVIVMLVSLIYVGTDFKKDPEGPLAKYGPLAVLGLLLLCVIYSAVAMVLQLRENCR